jgi:osmoprotectant transport system permease protein
MNWSGRQLAGNWDVIWYYTQIHIRIAVLSLVLGAVLAFVLGFLAYRVPRTYPVLLGACNALYAVPSLAMFAVLGSFLSLLEDRTLVFALALYSLVILLRNMVEGLRAVPPQVVDAATAMGLRPLRRFLTVELPLAVPPIVAGLRVAAVSTVSLITVGGFIGRGGLGRLFSDGFQRDISIEVWAGIVAVMVLALVFDMIIAFGGRVATPWTRVRAAR